MIPFYPNQHFLCEVGQEKVSSIRKNFFHNKSKFITEDQFTKHINITIK